MKYVVTLNGKKYEVEVNESEAVITSVSNAAPAAPVAPVAAPAQAPASSTAPGAPAAVVGTAVSGTQITSPMPGTILKLNVSEGQAVKAGDVVLILEAMKMENEIVAPQDGTVASINVSKSDSVEAGQVIITLN